MAERPSRLFAAFFAVIALVLGWVIVRDYILEPDDTQRDAASAGTEAPPGPE